MRGPDKNFSDSDKEEMNNLWESGVSQADIAYRFSTSRQYVHTIVRYKGIPYKKATPGPKAYTIEYLTAQFNTLYKIIDTTKCWEWIGRINKEGYGTLGRRLSHRLSWTIHNGDIPLYAHILHKCDNRKCVNPDHLYVGTHADNMLDKKAIRYSMEELKKIEELIKECENTPKPVSPTKKEIGKIFNLSQMTLWRMRKSNLWPCRDGVYKFNW